MFYIAKIIFSGKVTANDDPSHDDTTKVNMDYAIVETHCKSHSYDNYHNYTVMSLENMSKLASL